MYEALGWFFYLRVPYINPIPILYLAYHLTVPTRVKGLGVCFVCKLLVTKHFISER